MHNEEAYPSLTTCSGEGTWKELQNNHPKMYCSKIIDADIGSNIWGMRIHVKVLQGLMRRWDFSDWEKIKIATMWFIIYKINYVIFLKYQNRNINIRECKK